MEPPTKRRKTASTTPTADSEEAGSLLGSTGEDERYYSASSPSIELSNDRDIVCFGMLKFPTTGSIQYFKPFEPVEIQQDGQIFCAITKDPLGSVLARHAQLLELFKAEYIDMDLVISSLESPGNTRAEKFVLQAILYGDRDLGDGLKDVVRGQNLYLQDPIGATRDVVYWNPQRYYNSPDTRTSHFWATPDEIQATENQILHQDSLAVFTSGEDLGETEASNHVRTALKPHQKQALSFMLSRERGWNLDRANADVWSLKQDSRHAAHEYLNNVNGSSQYKPPHDFRGGIIADSMGSGKTLSMIALIAHDKIRMTNRRGVNTTLVVVPPPLLDNWRNEFSRHLSGQTFSWASHHARSKITSAEELEDVDILLTTYSTAATEWRTKRTGSILFLHNWHRVILDEAHCIKNCSAVTTQAAYHIQSPRRWAVTGTPIQNRLPELQSILAFIRAYPYDDKSTFDEDSKHRWVSGDGHEAVDRLKHLLGFIMLRRSHQASLPQRCDLKQTIEFDPKERAIYDEAAARTLVSIRGVLESKHSSDGYQNAVQKINVLRHICNLGVSNLGVDSELLRSSEPAREAQWGPEAAHKALNHLPTLGRSVRCIGCQEPIDAAPHGPECAACCQSTKCHSTWCAECASSRALDTNLRYLEPQCLSAKSSSPSSPSWTEDLAFQGARKEYPTKIRALVEDLRRQPIGTKRLTLTAASWVYLMEPQWNPGIEDQALARVYRIGQTKDVTTVRFVISNSIEDYVLDVQDRKRDLITVLMSSKGSSVTRGLLERLAEYIKD
ncbi:hypothetical protein FZEAL_7572 [Fusarium zealandicum]|uniref:Helicase ATP-binding domain-containing protein n=1 Tax=Fusarium zealandicum TaxID=1053134 RepID=A0A8H4UGD8_9HYPO|nr:hypothetical protein FZEAL_7572 [Fusarium zealandicum]